jgi:molybdopterin molybdotransferase
VHTTISLKEALTKALKSAPVKRDKIIVMLNEANGKIVSKDIIANKNMPSFDNSAMDGYAFKHIQKNRPLRIAQTIYAGDTPKASLLDNECYKIMTGAQVPNDADTIAPFEVCEKIDQNTILPPSEIKKGANLRTKGEETTKGEVLINKGERLDASRIALLAAQGITAIEVYAPLRIALLSSGDEIKEPWEQASDDEIYNANAFGITALLEHYGFRVYYLGKIPDNFETTKKLLCEINSYDVIITTGGISQGEADFIYKAFLANALEVLFHGINVKPGHPTMMGSMGKSFVIGLPGNPLTTMVMAHTLAIPTLFAIQGSTKTHHNFSSATLTEDLNLKGDRTHLVLGVLENGEFTPTRGGKVGSGMILPLCESNAIAYIDEGITKLNKGSRIYVTLLEDTTRSKEGYF